MLIFNVLRFHRVCCCLIFMIPSGESVCGQEDTDALPRQRPWKPDRADLPAPLREHRVLPLVLRMITNETPVLSHGSEMFVLKFFLCVSLKGTVTGIYWLASPTATLWLFPLTSGRLGRSSIRLTTTKRVSTAWPSRQRWTRLPPVETTGTHTHTQVFKRNSTVCLWTN